MTTSAPNEATGGAQCSARGFSAHLLAGSPKYLDGIVFEAGVAIWKSVFDQICYFDYLSDFFDERSPPAADMVSQPPNVHGEQSFILAPIARRSQIVGWRKTPTVSIPNHRMIPWMIVFVRCQSVEDRSLIEFSGIVHRTCADAEDASFRCTNSEFGREAQVSNLNDSVVPPVVPRRELRDPKLPAPVDHRRLGACAAQAATRGEQGWINGNVQALPDGFGLNRLRL